jgi:hypothetical protein
MATRQYHIHLRCHHRHLYVLIVVAVPIAIFLILVVTTTHIVPVPAGGYHRKCNVDEIMLSNQNMFHTLKLYCAFIECIILTQTKISMHLKLILCKLYNPI